MRPGRTGRPNTVRQVRAALHSIQSTGHGRTGKKCLSVTITATVAGALNSIKLSKASASDSQSFFRSIGIAAKAFDQAEVARLYAVATGVVKARRLILDAVKLYTCQRCPDL